MKIRSRTFLADLTILAVFAAFNLMFIAPVLCEEKQTVQVATEVVEKSMPYYRYSLRTLMREAQENIKKLDRKLKEKESEKVKEQKEGIKTTES